MSDENIPTLTDTVKEEEVQDLQLMTHTPRPPILEDEVIATIGANFDDMWERAQ